MGEGRLNPGLLIYLRRSSMMKSSPGEKRRVKLPDRPSLQSAEHDTVSGMTRQKSKNNCDL
jgi:hypothetical protein